jgi:FAD/FMN-containing dehydrogenase
MPSLTNWNDEIQYTVPDDRYKTPTQVSEVQEIVREAFKQDQRVTVIGAMHSTTECTIGTGIIISLKKMARIISVNQERLTVTVEGGVSLRELCAHLKPSGLQPPVILEWGNFHIGAISGTHANDTSMNRSAQFSSFVLGVKLVAPNGEIMEISESQNAEYLPAVRSHFGMLGVVCEVTMRIFKSQPLEISFQVAEIGGFLDNFGRELQALKAEYDQVFGMLFPTSGKLLFQRRKFVDSAKSKSDLPETQVENKNIISLFGDLFLPLVKAITVLQLPAAVAAPLNKVLIDLPLKWIRNSTYTIDPCDRGVIYEEGDPNFEFYDWVFPEEKWCDIVRAFLQLSDRFRREHNFILLMPVAVYFLKQDQSSLLSRSRKGNMIAVDPLYPDPTDPTWKAFRLAFNEIAVLHGGVPHINKTRDGAISNLTKTHDPESIRRFLQIRKQLDPKDLFLNDYFRTLFGI